MHSALLSVINKYSSLLGTIENIHPTCDIVKGATPCAGAQAVGVETGGLGPGTRPGGTMCWCWVTQGSCAERGMRRGQKGEKERAGENRLNFCPDSIA